MLSNEDEISSEAPLAIVSTALCLMSYYESGFSQIASRRSQALGQARTEAQADREIQNAVEASDKLKQLYARIAYLRTITPRRPGDGEQLGAGRFVLRDGRLVPSDLRPDSRCSFESSARRFSSCLSCAAACGGNDTPGAVCTEPAYCCRNTIQFCCVVLKSSSTATWTS